MKATRHKALFAVKWNVEVTGEDDAQDTIAIEFLDVQGKAARVLLHHKEAARLNKALTTKLTKAFSKPPKRGA